MHSVVGIELGKDTFKVLRVEFKRKSVFFADFFADDIGIDAQNAVCDRVSKILDKKKSNTVITLFLPRNQVTVRNLHLPAQGPSEIKRMIDLHIGRIVPYKKEDVVYCYKTCGNDSSGYTRVMLAIAHNDMIKDQLRSVDSAGILVDSIVLSTCGIYQYVVNFYADNIGEAELFIILDVDKSFADFMVATNSSLLFTRTIQKKTMLDEEETIARFIGQIRQSLVIFNNEEMNTKPQKIFISGDFTEDLGERLSKELDIDVVYVDDVIRGVAAESNVNSLSRSSQMSVAGLLDHRFKADLVFDVPELVFKKALKKKIKDVMVLSFLILYFLSVIVMLFFVRLSSVNEYVSKLNTLSTIIEEDHGELIRNINQISMVSAMLENRKQILWVLYNLQKNIPDSIVLNYYSIEDQSMIVIRGKATASSQVFEFVNILNSLPEFNNAQALYTRQSRDKGSEVTDFEINFNMS